MVAGVEALNISRDRINGNEAAIFAEIAAAGDIMRMTQQASFTAIFIMKHDPHCRQFADDDVARYPQS